MNYNQNNKIMQLNGETLIVGIDIAKEKHVARAQDFRGVEVGKTLTFQNSRSGFNSLLKWISELSAQHSKNNTVVGVEPTGHYWFCLSKFLRQNGIEVVVVNPLHVKKSKELDDNSPTKNDTKDAKVISQLVKDGRFANPNIPEGIYADLRLAMDIRELISKDLISLKATIARWINIYFPEFEKVFYKWDVKTALLTLRTFPIPSKIATLSEKEIVQFWKSKIKGGAGSEHAELLLKAAKSSIGVTEGLDMAEYKLQYLLDKYDTLILKLDELMNRIQTIVDKIPGAAEMLLIPGLGLASIAGFLSEVSDLTHYAHPRQIQKLAGLTLKENSSGNHKGQTTITKRGRRKLRSLLFKVILPLVRNNKEFKALHHYYTTRSNNPLKKKQSLIALCCKLIRILFAIGTKLVAYNPQKMMDDISHPHLIKVA